MDSMLRGEIQFSVQVPNKTELVLTFFGLLPFVIVYQFLEIFHFSYNILSWISPPAGGSNLSCGLLYIIIEYAAC